MIDASANHFQPAELRRVILVGDSYGLPELLSRVPGDRVAAVVCAAIRPDGQGEIRELADRVGVPLLVQPRPTSPEFPAFVQAVAQLRADGLLCHSYSMRIPPTMLAMVEGRAFNVHMSRLPRHRGPNPVQWALIHGDSEAGVTLHVMDSEFDRGPIVAQRVVPIDLADTWLTLREKLEDATAMLLDDALPTVLNGVWTATAQHEPDAVRNHRLHADNVGIDWSAMTDRQVFDLIRAQVAPLAGAFVVRNGVQVRFPAALTLADVARLRAECVAHG